MLWDSIEGELEEKIRRLEEDKNNVDVTSQVWAEQNLYRKHKRHIQVKIYVSVMVYIRVLVLRKATFLFFQYCVK